MSVRTPLVVGQNDLATVHPSLAAQWNYAKNSDLTPQDVQVGSSKKVWWTCDEGHDFESRVANRTKLGNGCPFCSGRMVLVGFNDLGTVMPDIAAQWDYDRNEGLTPQDVTTGSNKRVWWKCDLGHGWQVSINNRKPGSGCVVCSGKTILAGFNDVATVYPQIMDRWDYEKNTIQPTEIGKSYAKKVHWKCDEGHSWEGTVHNESNRVECSFCGGRKLIAGVNDIATLSPHLVPEWNYAKNGVGPEAYKNTSSKKAWWTCSACEHDWEAIITNRTYNGTGCPVCAGQRIVVGKNDLASVRPDMASLWHPENTLKPTEVTVGNTAYMASWRCPEGHVWQARVREQSNRDGCGKCNRMKLPSGSRSLTEEFPLVAKDWAYDLNGDWRPENVASRSNRAFWWRCPDNPDHVWNVVVANRTDKNSNCPTCWRAMSTSAAEERLYELLVGLGVEVVRHNRDILDGVELDLYVPEHNFAVEYNGLYWHSEEMGKTEAYHIAKTEKCEARGIDLLHVWEDDWLERPEIVSRHIAARLGRMDALAMFHPEMDPQFTETVSVQDCAVREIFPGDSQHFLDDTHISGAVESGLHYGLFYQEQMRAILVVNPVAEHTWSVERYSIKGDIPEAMTALLGQVQEDLRHGNLVMDVDRSWDTGTALAEKGFTLLEKLAPECLYVKNVHREPMSVYDEQVFKNDPQLKYIEGMGVGELASLNGFRRIWNCGKLRYGKEF